MSDEKITALIAEADKIIHEKERNEPHRSVAVVFQEMRDALEASAQAPAVDREALVNYLGRALAEIYDAAYDDNRFTTVEEPLADMVIRSGILQDAAERDAQTLEDAAAHMPGGGMTSERWEGTRVEYATYETSPDDRSPQAWLRARAAAIREGRA